jgi:hypothetical protein
LIAAIGAASSALQRRRIRRSVDALEAALAGEGVGEARLSGRLAGGGVDEDAARAGDAGHATREVDRPAVVVARLRQGRAGGDAGAQDRELVPFGGRGGDEVEGLRHQRLGLRRHQHHRVADRLHQAHRRRHDTGRELLEVADDLPQLLRRDLLAEAGELDQVGEADRPLDHPTDLPRRQVRGTDHVAFDQLQQVRLEGIFEELGPQGQ